MAWISIWLDVSGNLNGSVWVLGMSDGIVCLEQIAIRKELTKYPSFTLHLDVIPWHQIFV